MLNESISALDYELLKQKYSESQLEQVIKKIIDEDYPVQYAIGNVQFIDKIIEVDSRVLVPRFATELLVSKTIEYVKKYNLENGPFIDICTGSGCIAICLADKFESVKVEACDKSADALDVASRNAMLNSVNIDFYNLDILGVQSFKNRYSLIIANPPYVKSDEVVSQNTRYEPKIALYPGDDDIIFYKKIIDIAKNDLLDKGMIAFEIGSTQGDRIKKYAMETLSNIKVSIEKDYEGFDRYVFIFKNVE